MRNHWGCESNMRGKNRRQLIRLGASLRCVGRRFPAVWPKEARNCFKRRIQEWNENAKTELAHDKCVKNDRTRPGCIDVNFCETSLKSFRQYLRSTRYSKYLRSRKFSSANYLKKVPMRYWILLPKIGLWYKSFFWTRARGFERIKFRVFI